MTHALVLRIERRLHAVGLSSEAACDAAGLRSSNLIRQMRRAALNGKAYNPRSGTLAALAPILMTTEEWLLHERGPEEVMPPKELLRQIATAKAKSRKPRINKKFDIRKTGHDVKIVDKSIHIEGAKTLGIPQPVSAGFLLGQINAAIIDAYAEIGARIGPEDLGRIAADQYLAVVASAETPDEYPHAIEIMKIRLRRLLANGDRSKIKTRGGKR